MAKELFILTQRDTPIGYFITSDCDKCSVIYTKVDNPMERSFKEIIQDFLIECGRQGVEVYLVEEWNEYDIL